jgi:hypothetical protein
MKDDLEKTLTPSKKGEKEKRGAFRSDAHSVGVKFKVVGGLVMPYNDKRILPKGCGCGELRRIPT